MRKLFKKSLACILAAIICVSLCVAAVPASAATPTYSTNAVEAKAGETVEIDFTVSNFANVKGAMIKFFLPEVVATIDAVTINGEALPAYDAETGAGYYQVDNAAKSIKFLSLFGFDGELAQVATLTFKVTATIAEDAAEGTYTYADPYFSVSENGTDLVEVTGTFGEFKVVPAVVEPALDSKITITASINITETINLRILTGSLPACDDFYIELTHPQFDNSYNYAEPYVEKFYKDDIKAASGGRYYFIYNKLGMAQLNIPVTTTVYCLDENDNVIYYSNSNVTTVADAAKTGYNSTSVAKTKTLYTDIINLAAESQKFFVNGKACDLGNIALPNEGFTGTPTADIAKDKLAKYDETNIINSKISFGAIALNLTSNPVLRFMVNGAATFDATTFKVVVSYTSLSGDVKSATWTKDTMKTSGSGANIRYYDIFSQIALMDGNQPVTCAVYDGDTLLATRTYSIETIIYNAAETAAAAGVYAQVAKLGASARVYFGYTK